MEKRQDQRDLIVAGYLIYRIPAAAAREFLPQSACRPGQLRGVIGPGIQHGSLRGSELKTDIGADAVGNGSIQCQGIAVVGLALLDGDGVLVDVIQLVLTEDRVRAPEKEFPQPGGGICGSEGGDAQYTRKDGSSQQGRQIASAEGGPGRWLAEFRDQVIIQFVQSHQDIFCLHKKIPSFSSSRFNLFRVRCSMDLTLLSEKPKRFAVTFTGSKYQ